jgi:hypothetical protein
MWCGRYDIVTSTNTTQGASPRELVFESCRRNNTELLEETIANIASSAGKSGGKPTELVAQILNSARDGVGNGVLHVAATYGSCKCLTLEIEAEY